MPAIKPTRHVGRSSVPLRAKAEKTLLSYAAAASAAGVGLLATAQPSEAKIVYTPTHTVVSPNTSLKIDLNSDGIDDFTFTEFGFAGRIANTGSTHSSGFLNVRGAQSANQVIGAAHQPTGYASALAGRVMVGASGHFLSSKSQLMEGCLIMQGTAVVSDGKWINAKSKYLGLKFVIHGQTHFGWARISVRKSGCSITAVLTGYAYETVANKSIFTGKTSGPTDAADSTSLIESPVLASIGLLAQGFPALSVWRREERDTPKGT